MAFSFSPKFHELNAGRYHLFKRKIEDWPCVHERSEKKKKPRVGVFIEFYVRLLRCG